MTHSNINSPMIFVGGGLNVLNRSILKVFDSAWREV